VIYEQIKAQLQLIQSNQNRSPDDLDLFNFISYLCAAACSKSCASTLCYPHEVIRTRLREEGTKYRTFIQTFRTILYEESFSGLYRGLLTHLIRQIPVKIKSFIYSLIYLICFL
jgi:solute carrier family 25 protein 33/36